MRLRELAEPLHCSLESGGLAIYYEIVSQNVYTPKPSWRPQPGQTVVDVGANIGVFSLWAGSALAGLGQLVAIEPNPIAFGMLERNVANLPIVEPKQLACGEKAETLTMHYPPGKLSVGSFEERPDRTESVDVPVRRLDEVLDATLGRIHLLKIDVEGFELAVLSGGPETLARTDRVVLEIAGTDLEPAEKLLTQAGFERVGDRDGLWNLSRDIGVVTYYERRD